MSRIVGLVSTSLNQRVKRDREKMKEDDRSESYCYGLGAFQLELKPIGAVQVRDLHGNNILCISRFGFDFAQPTSTNEL